MDKFEKRLRKLTRNANNALVIGDAFGNLEKIVLIFNTVFVIGNTSPTVKAKNLVYKQNFDHLTSITDTGAIFFNLSEIDKLEMLEDFWQRNNSIILVEGNEPIERNLSKPFYKTGWGCTSLQGLFHVWEKNK